MFFSFLKRRRLGLLIIASAAFFCASCDKGGGSILKSLETADKLISSGQGADALKELRRAEKSAFTASNRISIYKRYKRIGEHSLAEKLLKKSAKKFPESDELRALWGKHLLKSNKIDEAVKVSKPLSGRKFGSIYSEAVLKQNLKKNKNFGDINIFLSDSFSQVYSDIFSGTGDSRWLVNGALIHLKKGDYAKASIMEQKLISQDIELSSREALFWAKVQYDAGNYDVALWNLDKVSSEIYQAQVAALQSDCYTMLKDLELAEKSRSNILSKNGIDFSEVADKDILNVICVNSALWAYSAGEYSRAWELLQSVFNRDSSFVPALLSFGKIAWLDSRPIPKTDLEKTLRQTELRTEKMQKEDKRPRFLVSEAISRLSKIEERFRKTPDALEGLDAVIVERISLFLRTNSELPLKARTSEIWRTLELNEIEHNLYPPLLVYFSVQKLISYGFENDARNLFYNYINAKYLTAMRGKTEAEKSEVVSEVDVFGGEYMVPRENVPKDVIKTAFGDKIAKSASLMNVWEIEVAAYFALLDGNARAAKQLYEYVLFESGGVVNTDGGFDNISTLASAASAVNLAMIYSSQGEKQKALSLYGLASGKCEDFFTKSKILYRIAELYYTLGNLDKARLSIEYSISLDEQNADARLLKRKLNE